MTAHGLRHLCDAMSTQQSLQATSSSASGTLGLGLKALTISEHKIGGGGAALLGAMLADNRCLGSLSLGSLSASSCSLVEDDIDGEGQLAKGLQGNSTLEELHIANNPLLSKLVRCLATNNNTTLKTLKMGSTGMPAAEKLAHMIAYNRSLVKLGLHRASYSAKEWASVILGTSTWAATKRSNLLTCLIATEWEGTRCGLLSWTSSAGKKRRSGGCECGAPSQPHQMRHLVRTGVSP